MATRAAAATIDEKIVKPEQSELFQAQNEETEGFEQEEPEIEVKPDHQPERKDPDNDLQAQIKALKEAEAANLAENERLRKRAEEAEAQSAQHQAEVQSTKLSREEAQLDVIETAMSGAKNEAEAAKRDLAVAVTQGDVEAQVDAMERLATAKAYFSRLEEGQVELKSQIAQSKAQAERKVEQREQDPVEAMKIPERAKAWLREHREYATDQRKNARLQAAHYDAIDAGHSQFSTGYFQKVEELLGLKEAPEPEAEEEEADQPVTKTEKRTPIVSAPVSRTPPGGSQKPSQIRLTAAEVEAAKASGITPAEYAKQKQRLGELRKNGHYGEQ